MAELRQRDEHGRAALWKLFLVVIKSYITPNSNDITALQIDYMLAEELSKNNNDGYRGSQFLYKDANEPLNFGPAWGLDDGFGTCCGFPAGNYNSLSNPAIQPQGWVRCSI